MSFAGSPLRTSRRVDQHTFMNADDDDEAPSSPPRPHHTRAIPLSFAYGAPDLSPPKSSPPRAPRNPSPTRSRDHEDAESSHSHASQTLPGHEPAAIRYARLKQRNLAHAPAPATIVHPPVPTLVNDTSVNIASAFNQASASMSYHPVSTTGRRLAVPPSRLSRYQAKQAAGHSAVSPSGVDDEDDDDYRDASAASVRARSPFTALAQTAARAISPLGSILNRAVSPSASYILREGASNDEGAESSGFQSMVVPSINTSASYDYAREEEDVANMEADSYAKRAQAKGRRGGRVSLDDKAYRPGKSDDEGSDEEYTDDDSGKKRRKKKKKDTGHLMLPTIGYDKAHKKKKPVSKKRGVKGLADDEVASGSDRGSVARSVRGSVPPHVVEPEPDDSQDNTSGLDYPDDSQRVLSEEELPNGTLSHLESQTSPPNPRSRWFGHALGTMVRAAFDFMKAIVEFIAKLLFMFAILGWRALSSVWRIAVQNPYDWTRSTSNRLSSVLPSILQFLAAATVVWFAYAALSSSSTVSSRESVWDRVFNRPQRPFVPPDMPAADFQAAMDRLRVVESALADATRQLRSVARHSDDLDAKLRTASDKIEAETRRAAEAEEKLRSATARHAADLRAELERLSAQGSVDPDTLTALETRIANAEADVKSLKAVPTTAPGSQAAPAWWSKPGTKPPALKTSDGTDVTGLITTYVERAVGQLQRDTVGRADYALFSAGARVVPRLTTPSLVLKPQGWRRRVVGMITGYGYAVGHSPAVALHADVSLGNCWPFEGQKGQLGVVLARSVHIDGFTIEHAPREIAFGGKTAGRAAPREMEVWGLVDGDDNVDKVKAFLEAQIQNGVDPKTEHFEGHAPGAFVRLANFEYDLDLPQHVQTFAARPEVVSLGVDIGVVVLRVNTNWGDPDFTCLYRFRVHGSERVPEGFNP